MLKLKLQLQLMLKLKLIIFGGILLIAAHHSMATEARVISNEYHLVLGPEAPYSTEVGQNEVVKQIQTILHNYASIHNWQINSVSDVQVRDVSFFESQDADLAKNNLILRRRDRPDKVAWTLKLRKSNEFDQESVFQGARIPLKNKLERDIQWVRNDIKFVNYSESGNFELKDGITDISQILEYFPGIRDATSLPLSSPVSRILPVPILETTYTTAELIEPTTKVTLIFETIIWTVQNCNHRIIELSVKQMDSPDKEFIEAKIKEIYGLLPAQTAQVSKTKLINTICGNPNP